MQRLTKDIFQGGRLSLLRLLHSLILVLWELERLAGGIVEKEVVGHKKAEGLEQVAVVLPADKTWKSGKDERLSRPR